MLVVVVVVVNGIQYKYHTIPAAEKKYIKNTCNTI